MFKRLLGPMGHLANGISLWQALSAWSAFWTAVATVSGYAAYTLETVRTQGWGAAFFVGVGTAVVLMLVVSLGMFAWGHLKSRSATAASASAPQPAQVPAIGAAPPPAAADDLGQRVAALERGSAKTRALSDGVRKAAAGIEPTVAAAITKAEASLRENLGEAREAIQGEAEASREGDKARLDAVWNTWDHAFQQLRSRLDALERTPEVSAKPSAAEVPTPTGSGLYVGQLHVDANRLESDFLLEFAFIAFNGSATPLRLADLRGRIAYGRSVVAPDAEWATLRTTPAIRDDNLIKFAPFSEFMVVVSQHVEGALAAEMARDLAAGRRVLFILERLDVLLVAEDETDQVRMPVWGRVTCERLGERTITGRLAMASGAVTIRLG